MCSVLKLDNGKVVSIADKQTDRRTKPPSTVFVYRYIVHKIYTLLDLAPPKQNFWVRQWLRTILNQDITVGFAPLAT